MDDLRKFLASYNLEIKGQIQELNTLMVKVPDGTEAKWVCKLEKNEVVKYAELQGLLKSQIN